MTSLTAPLISPWKRLAAIGSLALLGVACAALAYLVLRIVQAFQTGVLPSTTSEHALWMLGLAALVYLFSHGLRILRLALLIGGWRVGFREVALFHLMTAAVSLTAPLKLGEIFRVVELSRLAGGFVQAVTAVWLERAFDIFIILVIILLTISSSAGISGYESVVGLSVAFITVTAVVLFVAPDNLRRLSVLIIRRYKSPKTIPILRAIDTTRRSIVEAPSLVRYKFSSLITLSTLIWSCELASFILAAPSIATVASAGKGALLAFLSSVTEGETLLSVLDSGSSTHLGYGVLPYLAATQVVLAMLGSVAAVIYVWKRLRK